MTLDDESVQRFRQAIRRARQRYEKAMAKIARDIENELDGTPPAKPQKKSGRDAATPARSRRQMKPKTSAQPSHRRSIDEGEQP